MKIEYRKATNADSEAIALLAVQMWASHTDSIIAVLKLFRNHYFEYTASFLERRYTQY